MKDQYTYEVGDHIDLHGAILGYDLVNMIEFGVPDQTAEIFYVDNSVAIALIHCKNNMEREHYLEAISNQYSVLDNEVVNNITKANIESSEFDFYIDAYGFAGWSVENDVRIYDKDGNDIPYKQVMPPEYYAYCGEQALDKIIFVKLYGGEPAPTLRHRPMTLEELNQLELCEDGNYFAVSVPITKEMRLGDYKMFYDDDDNLVLDGEVIYSSNNMAVLGIYKGPNDAVESEFPLPSPSSLGFKIISYNDLLSLPGNSYKVDNPVDYDYWMIEQITGESEEQLHHFPVRTANGEEFDGRIEGYYFKGRRLIARFISFPDSVFPNPHKQSEKAKIAFADKMADTSLMTTIPFEEGSVFLFEMDVNEKIKFLH